MSSRDPQFSGITQSDQPINHWTKSVVTTDISSNSMDIIMNLGQYKR
jgi:hypothetical protein